MKQESKPLTWPQIVFPAKEETLAEACKRVFWFLPETNPDQKGFIIGEVRL